MNEPHPADDLTLLDLLDRVVKNGVIIEGDVTLSLANIDLIYLSFRLLVASVAKLESVTGERFGLADR
jgi:hypothetical protein